MTRGQEAAILRGQWSAQRVGVFARLPLLPQVQAICFPAAAHHDRTVFYPLNIIYF